jgi:hypothetical protein
MNAPSLDTVRQLAAETPGVRWVPTERQDGVVVDLPWVPYGPGFEIPLYFVHSGSGPFDWQLLAVVVEGRPQCVYFECRARADGQPFTPAELHRFPLGRILEEGTLMASRREGELPRRAEAWANVDEVRAARAAVRAHHRRRPGRHQRQVLTDGYLARVAKVYRDHIATRQPSKAVAEQFKYTPSSARRVVREARLRGLLGPARSSRAGEFPDEVE